MDLGVQDQVPLLLRGSESDSSRGVLKYFGAAKSKKTEERERELEETQQLPVPTPAPTPTPTAAEPMRTSISVDMNDGTSVFWYDGRRCVSAAAADVTDAAMAVWVESLESCSSLSNAVSNGKRERGNDVGDDVEDRARPWGVKRAMLEEKDNSPFGSARAGPSSLVRPGREDPELAPALSSYSFSGPFSTPHERPKSTSPSPSIVSTSSGSSLFSNPSSDPLPRVALVLAPEPTSILDYNNNDDDDDDGNDNPPEVSVSSSAPGTSGTDDQPEIVSLTITSTGETFRSTTQTFPEHPFLPTPGTFPYWRNE